MEPNNINSNINKQKTSAKDFFLNLGAIVALYTVVFNLINLLFTVINKAYPQITTYYYPGTYSISWPVAVLIIFFPIFILLMWLLEKGYRTEPEKKNLSVRKWLTYITLFIAGLSLAGDLVTVLYYFIDGQELTVGFLLKALVVLIMAGLVFYYYISDIREKLTSQSRKIWLAVSALIIIGAIVWGFAVLGSPRTQQLYKYDEQKVSDLQNINSEVQNYYQMKNVLPAALSDLTTSGNYFILPADEQTGAQYEYQKTGNASYQLCATFNKDLTASSAAMQTYPVQYGATTWNHPAGHYCFPENVMLPPSAKSI